MADWYFIPTPAAGRLAIVARPRGGDWLADDVARWKHLGIDSVLSLLTDSERDSLNLQNEATELESQGIAALHLPITDRGVPAQRKAFENRVRQAVAAVQRGKTFAVHCRQGIGRAPLFAIAVLMAMGINRDASIEAVSQARGVPVPETDGQREWLTTLFTESLQPS